MKRIRIVDPSPGGWAYGFPRECPEDVTDLGEWAVSHGYPRCHLEFVVFRQWYMEVKPPAEPYHVEGDACQ